MPSSRKSSIKRLLLTNEIALVLLVTITSGLGAAWAYFWHHTAAESVRLNDLSYTAQRIRGELFRQIKDVTRARLTEDPSALRLYTEYSDRIEGHFNSLRQRAAERDEEYAIQDMQHDYRVIQQDMNKIFTDPYMINRVVRMRILRPEYEEKMVGDFEQAFRVFQEMVAHRLDRIRASRERWTRLAPLVITIPIVLGVVLLLLSRRALQRGLVQPVASIVEGARLMSTGQLQHRIPVQGADEIAELSEAINGMAADLSQSRDALVEKEKQAALGALVPVVAHNIRNPLASIRASAQLLEHTDDRAEIHEIKQAVIDTVDRLGRWVNALVSYLHPSRPHLVRNAPANVIDASLAMLETRLRTKSLQVVRHGWNEDYWIMADVDLMEQALYGLLSNAIDASPQGGAITVELTRMGSDLKLQIADQGPGISFQPEPSGLSPGPTTKRSGTGLGIPAAFKICKAHGWPLDFASQDKGGTRVTIMVPMTQELGVTV